MYKNKKLFYNIADPAFFWFLFLIDAILSPSILILSNIGYGDSLYSLHKILNTLYLVSAAIISIKFKLKLNKISLLFLFFSCISIVIGLAYNEVTFENSRGILFSYLNPILMMNLTRVYMKRYNIEIIGLHLKGTFKYYIPITIAFYLIYLYYHYVSKRFNYYGFQTNWQYASVYLVYSGKNILGLLGLFLVLISGKRATLVTTIIPYFTRILSLFKKISLKNIIIFSFFVVIIVGLFTYAYNEGYLRRFESTFKMSLNDRESLSAGTSGRSDEVMLIIEELKEYTPFIFLGKGIGATYTVVGNDYDLEKNFSHIAPAHFSFQYGIIFTILLYLFFLQLIIKGFKRDRNNLFYNFFLVVFFGSFFGANLMVDPKTWFFIGLYYYYLKNQYNKSFNISC